MRLTKYLIATVCFLFTSLTLHAQVGWNAVYQNYFDQYKNLAIEQMFKYHIPASITLAQGVFESGAGRSTLAVKGNNHFGIKCHGWTGRSMQKDDDAPGECFRVYDNVRDSYEDHSKFLREKKRYARLFALDPKDYRGWAWGLKECGYATNPRYAENLINIIEVYQLYAFDQAKRPANYHDGLAERHKNRFDKDELHPITIYNKNYYLIAKSGDSFKSIGKEIGVSGRKIARYNERSYHDTLIPGELVYLKKKQKHALKAYKNKPHIVQPGESMYSIAQTYGIRLKQLYKKNHLSPEHDIMVGDRLRVY